MHNALYNTIQPGNAYKDEMKKMHKRHQQKLAADGIRRKLHKNNLAEKWLLPRHALTNSNGRCIDNFLSKMFQQSKALLIRKDR